MCVPDGEQVGEDKEKNVDNRSMSWPLHCGLLHAQMDNREKDSSFRTPSDQISVANSFPLESICEDTEIVDKKQNQMNFVPTLRSGEWSDIGDRPSMEDTHICIGDLAEEFGNNVRCEEAISFYGVFDGHGGKSAAQFVRDHLPQVIVEDAGFPIELEKVVTRSFLETDAQFAKSCSKESSLSSGTTALTAIIFGR
ncbi:phosphatase 2C 27 [Spatholobus suberectus]|nr:phosphatase 2C 27 [Spatholobus suberectus]